MGENLRNRVATRAATSTAEVTDRPKSLTDLVRDMEPEFKRAAPKGVEAAQVVRDVLTLISNNPKLRDCQPLSVLGGAMTMAQLGLRPGVLGHGWLLPFKKWDPKARTETWNAQLVIGYKGMAELVARSGLVTDVGVHPVYERDQFVMGFEDGRRVFTHRPDWWSDRGVLLGWYGAARERGQDVYTLTEPWSVAQAEAHRDAFAMAKTKDKATGELVIVGPWRDHFEAMARKTVLLDLMKLLPKSTDVQRAIEADGGVRVNLTPEGIEDTERVVDGEVVHDTHEETPAEQAPADVPAPGPEA